MGSIYVDTFFLALPKVGLVEHDLEAVHALFGLDVLVVVHAKGGAMNLPKDRISISIN